MTIKELEEVLVDDNALEKAVPMKPYVNRIHDYDGWNTDLMVYQCGRCRRRLRTKATRDKYCPSCGQRVRWEE